MREEKTLWGKPVSGCRLSIARAAPVDQKYSVTLQILFQNGNTNNVEFPRTSLWFDYSFSVLDAAGSAVPLTAFGEQQRENMTTAAAALAEVSPGQAYRCEVELSRLYQMDHAGSYTVQASKTFRDPATVQFVTASSNELTISQPVSLNPGEPRD